MCYDIKVSLERQLKVAKHYGDQKVIEEIEKNLLPLLNPLERELYQVSGFSHPSLFVMIKDHPVIPVLASWGLIPEWIKDEHSAMDISNKTLNARIEGMLNKPSYREPSRKGRCVISVDGFFEHRHIGDKAFPYYIDNVKSVSLELAGLSEEWVNPTTGELLKTFTIITRKSNEFMSEIHNNPKLPESRMPLILTSSEVKDWISDKTETELEEMVHMFEHDERPIDLKAHTVRPIKGRNAIPNNPLASEKFSYAELEKDLFD